MKRLMVLLSLWSGVGCACERAHTGWRFEVLRPPTVDSSSLVSSGPAPLGILGQRCGGDGFDWQGFDLPPPRGQSFRVPGSPSQLTIPPPVLDELFRRLDALERKAGIRPKCEAEGLSPPQRAQE